MLKPHLEQIRQAADQIEKLADEKFDPEKDKELKNQASILMLTSADVAELIAERSK